VPEDVVAAAEQYEVAQESRAASERRCRWSTSHIAADRVQPRAAQPRSLAARARRCRGVTAPASASSPRTCPFGPSSTRLSPWAGDRRTGRRRRCTRPAQRPSRRAGRRTAGGADRQHGQLAVPHDLLADLDQRVGPTLSGAAVVVKAGLACQGLERGQQGLAVLASQDEAAAQGSRRRGGGAAGSACPGRAQPVRRALARSASRSGAPPTCRAGRGSSPRPRRSAAAGTRAARHGRSW
jgi:hypothetical protein